MKIFHFEVPVMRNRISISSPEGSLSKIWARTFPATVGAALLLLAACSSPEMETTGPGWVRSVWTRQDATHIVFETEAGELRSYRYWSRSVPTWKGMHCEIIIRQRSLCGEDSVQVIRLGPDASEATEDDRKGGSIAAGEKPEIVDEDIPF